MRGTRYTRVILSAMLFCLRILQLRAQPGFVSIDCGASENYTDSLGLSWATDGGYVRHGETADVNITDANLGPDAEQIGPKLQTLRYFPADAYLSCYFIPLSVGLTHLFRLMFLGGDFSAGIADTTFFMTLGHFVTKIQINDSRQPVIQEYVMVALEDPFPICFLRYGNSSLVPFVSSIEVRPLPQQMYTFGVRFAVLQKVFQFDCGTKTGLPSVRYPADPFDRLWAADPPDLKLTSVLNSSALPDNLLNIDNDAPIKVLQTAWSSQRISFMVDFPQDAGGFYIALYFAELSGNEMNSTNDRELIAYVDGVPLTTGVIKVNGSTFQTPPRYLLPQTYPARGGLAVNVTIVPTANSTRGAILNAAEVWTFQIVNDTWFTDDDDVSAIKAIKVGLNLTEYEGDPCYPISYEWVVCGPSQASTRVVKLNLSNRNISGTIPESVGLLSALTELNLDKNNITGTLPDFSYLERLQSIRLQSNRLEGPIPDFLAELPVLTLLTLDDNLFEGDVPADLLSIVDSGFLTFSAVDNPYLCYGANLCLPKDGTNGSDEGGSKVGVIVGAAAGGVVVLLLGLVLLYCLRKRHKSLETGKVSESNHHPNKANSFTWAEVRAATNEFSRLLGKGGFGDVYLGTMPDGKDVAVKVNKGVERHTSEQFLNEVALLLRIHHRNLVSFIGYCSEGDHQVLIYAFMSEGNLQEHIYDEGKADLAPSRSVLDWRTRLDILVNAARGLEYLHNSCNPPIIHRDIKTANILLNDKLAAKISDFGISKATAVEDKVLGVTTVVKGSFGYLDPEYFETQRLTMKSDVYSFGVVILETVTGKSPRTTKFLNSRATNLREWVESYIREGNIHAIIDPHLAGKCNLETIWKVIEIALQCLRERGVDRPEMQRVSQCLSEAKEFDTEPPGTTAGHSPSDLHPNAFDHYQRVEGGVSSGRSSKNGSIAVYDTISITGR